MYKKAFLNISNFKRVSKTHEYSRYRNGVFSVPGVHWEVHDPQKSMLPDKKVQVLGYELAHFIQCFVDCCKVSSRYQKQISLKGQGMNANPYGSGCACGDSIAKLQLHNHSLLKVSGDI